MDGLLLVRWSPVVGGVFPIAVRPTTGRSTECLARYDEVLAAHCYRGPLLGASLTAPHLPLAAMSPGGTAAHKTMSGRRPRGRRSA